MFSYTIGCFEEGLQIFITITLTTENYFSMVFSPLVQAQASLWCSFEREWSINTLTLKFFDPSLAYTEWPPFSLQIL